MRVEAVRAAQVASGLTKAEWSRRLGISRDQLMRMLAGTRAVSAEVADKVRADSEAHPADEAPAAAVVVALPPASERPGHIEECLKRDPLYSESAAEGRAMRAVMAQRANLGPAQVALIPLRPRMIKVGEVYASAAIPEISGEPLDEAERRQFGWRGVKSDDGYVYDYESAHRMGAY